MSDMCIGPMKFVGQMEGTEVIMFILMGNLVMQIVSEIDWWD